MPTPIIEARNLGPKSVELLESLDIYTLEELVERGWEDVFLMLAQAYPEYLNLNFAYAMIGAIKDIHFNDVSKTDKEDARIYVKQLKQRFGYVAYPRK